MDYHPFFRWLLILGLVVCGILQSGRSEADDTRVGVPSSPILSEPNTEALAQLLRQFLVHNLPVPLIEDQKDWGRTIRVANGIKWKGKGLHGRPEITHADKNQGTWRKVRIAGVNLPQTLVFDIRDIHKVNREGVRFSAFISFNARVDATQQKWEAGLKLYDGGLRARFRVNLLLQCEVASWLEPNVTFIPDLIFRLRVRKADLQYDRFVTEHVAGIGGEAARLLGEAIRKSLRPALEQRFLNEADAAIVKAGDTKEVRLSLASLLK